MSLIRLLKNIPIDLGQEKFKYTTKGKHIALALVGDAPVSEQTALDVGCRDGHFTRLLYERGFSVTAIDVECRTDFCVAVDVNKKLPYSDNTFDVIWCSEVIEHLEDPLFSVNEFRRVLKPRGKAVITTPNSAFWIYPILRFFGKRPSDVQNPTHIHFFNRADIDVFCPKDDVVYGFFPYIGVKFQIKNRFLVGMLSPTFIFEVNK